MVKWGFDGTAESNFARNRIVFVYFTRLRQPADPAKWSIVMERLKAAFSLSSFRRIRLDIQPDTDAGLVSQAVADIEEAGKYLLPFFHLDDHTRIVSTWRL